MISDSGQKPNVRAVASRDSEAQAAACASEGGKAHTALLVVRVFVTLAVAMFLLIQLPSSGPQPEAISNIPLIGSPLTFRTDATESEINSAGAQLLASYRPFALARAVAATLSRLRLPARNPARLSPA